MKKFVFLSMTMAAVIVGSARAADPMQSPHNANCTIQAYNAGNGLFNVFIMASKRAFGAPIQTNKAPASTKWYKDGSVGVIELFDTDGNKISFFEERYEPQSASATYVPVDAIRTPNIPQCF